MASAHLCLQAGRQSPKQIARCRCCRSAAASGYGSCGTEQPFQGGALRKQCKPSREMNLHIARMTAHCSSPVSLANTGKPHALKHGATPSVSAISVSYYSIQ